MGVPGVQGEELMQVLVDATVWIAYFRGDVTARTDLLHELLGYAPLVTADLVLAELFRGFPSEADLEQERAALARFPRYEIARIWPSQAPGSRGSSPRRGKGFHRSRNG